MKRCKDCKWFSLLGNYRLDDIDWVSPCRECKKNNKDFYERKWWKFGRPK